MVMSHAIKSVLILDSGRSRTSLCNYNARDFRIYEEEATPINRWTVGIDLLGVSVYQMNFSRSESLTLLGSRHSNSRHN